MYFPLENRGYFRSSVRWNYWSVISGWCKISYARSLLSKYSCYPSPKGPRANKLNNNFKMKPSSRKCLISHITKITYSQYHLKKYIKNSESAFTSIATGTFLEGNPFKPLFATVFGWRVDPTDMFFFWGSLLWNCPSLGTDPRESNGKKQILVFFFRRAKFEPCLESRFPHRGKRGTLGMEGPGPLFKPAKEPLKWGYTQ